MLGKWSKPGFSGRFVWFEMQTCYVLSKLRDRIVVRNLNNHDKRHSGRLNWHHWSICPQWCRVTHFAQHTDCCALLTRIRLWQRHNERSDTLGSQQSSQLAWDATALHPSLCRGWAAVLPVWQDTPSVWSKLFLPVLHSCVMSSFPCRCWMKHM